MKKRLVSGTYPGSTRVAAVPEETSPTRKLDELTALGRVRAAAAELFQWWDANSPSDPVGERMVFAKLRAALAAVGKEGG